MVILELTTVFVIVVQLLSDVKLQAAPVAPMALGIDLHGLFVVDVVAIAANGNVHSQANTHVRVLVVIATIAIETGIAVDIACKESCKIQDC